MISIKVKRLVLVTGDEYEQVELSKDIPDWIKENVPEDFIGVKSDTFKALINTSMIVSLEIDEKTKMRVISSQSLESIEKCINSIRFDEKELKMLVGKDRYETIVKEIKEVFSRNGLDEIKSALFIHHLNQIYQLEQKHQ